MWNENHPLIKQARTEQRVNLTLFLIGSVITMIGASILWGVGGLCLAVGLGLVALWAK